MNQEIHSTITVECHNCGEENSFAHDEIYEVGFEGQWDACPHCGDFNGGHVTEVRHQ